MTSSTRAHKPHKQRELSSKRAEEFDRSNVSSAVSSRMFIATDGTYLRHEFRPFKRQLAGETSQANKLAVTALALALAVSLSCPAALYGCCVRLTCSVVCGWTLMCVFGRVRQAAGRHDAEEEAVQHTELSHWGASPRQSCCLR